LSEFFRFTAGIQTEKKKPATSGFAKKKQQEAKEKDECPKKQT